MRLVDTAAWIESTSETRLGQALRPELPPREGWLVPTIVQFELARWLAREAPEQTAHRILAFSSRCVVAPLDTRTALRAAEIASERALAMADAIIYATALEYGADLLTCDAHFAKLDKVVYLAKGQV